MRVMGVLNYRGIFFEHSHSEMWWILAVVEWRDILGLCLGERKTDHLWEMYVFLKMDSAEIAKYNPS